MKHIASHQGELAAIIARHITEKGGKQSLVPGLVLARQPHVSPERNYSVFTPSLCIVAQGEKEILLAQERFLYTPADYLVASADLPITARVLQASEEHPYLSLKLEFTDTEILNAMQDLDMQLSPKSQSRRAIFVEPMTSVLQDAVLRLVRLLDRPADIPLYAPLYRKEILLRVLQGPHGFILGHSAFDGSNLSRVREVLAYIMKNYEKPFQIEDLAEIARMSVASLHRHFKIVTAMSPIQYQKQLRLQTARRLLLTESTDAADVSFRVGYESPSQFSREYSRMFGASPIQDIRRIRSTSGESMLA